MGLFTLNEQYRYRNRTDPNFSAKFTFITFFIIGIIIIALLSTLANTPDKVGVNQSTFWGAGIGIITLVGLFMALMAYMDAREFQAAKKVYQDNGFNEQQAHQEALADIRQRALERLLMQHHIRVGDSLL